MPFLVVGATGATGVLLVKTLLRQDVDVRVIVRDPQRLPAAVREHPKLTVIHAAVLDLDDAALRGAVAGCTAVASCLGHTMTRQGMWGEPRKLCTDVTRRLCEAIEATSPSQRVRFLLMNTAGNVNHGSTDPAEQRGCAQRAVVGLIRAVLPPHVDNEQAAGYLQNVIGPTHSCIDWVVIRPDTLTDDKGVTPYDATAAPVRDCIFNSGQTSRVNVAHFMAELATKDDVFATWKGAMPVLYNRAYNEKMPWWVRVWTLATAKQEEQPEEAAWTPNAALQEQISLQRRCDDAVYVVRAPSSDESNGEVALPLEVEHAAALAFAREQFRDAAATGAPRAVHQLFTTLRDHGRVRMDGKLFGIASDVLEAQLAMEFGVVDPSNAKHLRAAGSSAEQRPTPPNRSHTTVTERPDLLVSERARTSGRRFLPGGPAWLADPDGFMKVFEREYPDDAAEFKHQWQDALHNIKGQRRADRAELLLQAMYHGETDKALAVQEHRRRYALAGIPVATTLAADVETTWLDISKQKIDFHPKMDAARPPCEGDKNAPLLRCEHCSARLDMPWPPECICGMPYCSDACHAAGVNDQDHDSTCHLVVEAQSGALDLTEWYWRLVVEGAIHFAGTCVPDFVAEWQAVWRAKTATARNAEQRADAELQFYFDKERPALQERLGKLQDRRDTAEDKAAAVEACLDEMMLQVHRATKPLKPDSAARLQFKLLLIACVYQPMSSAIFGPATPEQLRDGPAALQAALGVAMRREQLSRAPVVRDLSGVNVVNPGSRR